MEEQRRTGRVGVPLPTRRAAAGPNIDTPHYWKRRDFAEEGEHVSFAEAVRRKEQQYMDYNGEDRVRCDGSEAVVEPARKKTRRTSEGGWTVGMELVLVELAQEFRPFKVAGRKATVAGQWRLINAKILAEKSGPIGTTLAGVSMSRLQSHFTLLQTKKKRQISEEARLSSGGNSAQVQGQEAGLGKGTGDIVDAIHADLSAEMVELNSKEDSDSGDSDREDPDSEDPDSEDSDSEDSDSEYDDWKVRAKASKLSRDKFHAKMPAGSLCENDRRAGERLFSRLAREQHRVDRGMKYDRARKLEKSRQAHERKVLAAQRERQRREREVQVVVKVCKRER